MAPPDSSCSLRFLLGGILLRHARSAENGGYHRISLVAGPLVDRPLGLRHGNFGGPWFSPSGRIFSGKLVNDRVVAGSREAFHQVQLLAGSSACTSIGELGRVDNRP